MSGLPLFVFCINTKIASVGPPVVRAGEDLRQHENGGRSGIYRQGPPVQPPFSADVRTLFGRAGGLHASGWLGEGAGRKPGRQHPRAAVCAASADSELRSAECLAARPVILQAETNSHPEQTDRTIWEVFEAERAVLVPLVEPFDGFRATQSRVYQSHIAAEMGRCDATRLARG